MTTGITDLPLEILAKIFSFLKRGDILKLSVVSSIFNCASKHPSLWRKCKIVFRSNYENNILSFCSFFGNAPYLRELSLTVWLCHGRKFPSELESRLSRLFESLKNLHCLHIDFDFKKIRFPSTLRHLHCRLNLIDPVNEEQFSFLKESPNIEFLYLDTLPVEELSTADISTILKYQLPLTSFYLKVDHFDEGWIPWIVSCCNLKEFGIEIIHGARQASLSKLFASSLSSRLEIIHVIGLATLETFSDFTFPELKKLTINSEFIDFESCKRLLMRMPKLETFHLTGQSPIISDVETLNFLKRCKSLKHVVLPTERYDVEVDLKTKFMESNEGNIPENQWHISMVILHEDINMSPCKCPCWDPVNKPQNAIIVPTLRELKLEYDVYGSYDDDFPPPVSSSDLDQWSSDDDHWRHWNYASD